MPAPTNLTARMWRETCPDQLLPLVDALMICLRKVRHPFILRATQRLNKCHPAWFRWDFLRLPFMKVIMGIFKGVKWGCIC